MDELEECFKKQGAEIVGQWPTEGYEHEDSKSVRGDKFVGCAFDEDNQPDMSEERAKKWLAHSTRTISRICPRSARRSGLRIRRGQSAGYVRGAREEVGCAFDEDNQPDMSEERAKKWAAHSTRTISRICP